MWIRATRECPHSTISKGAVFMHGHFRRLSMTAAALLIGLLALVAVAPASNEALAQGEQKTVTKQLEPFTSLQINGGGHATLEFGPEPSVTIEGNSLIVDRLDAKVENGELTLGSMLTSALDITGLSDLTYTIVTPSIEAIHLAGTITLDVPSLPQQDAIELGLTTGAELTMSNMQVGSVTGKLDLLSTAHLAGSADTMQLEISKGAELDAGDLQVGTADLKVTGISKATVRVTDALTGTASEGSTVNYISETVEPSINLSTLASINQMAFTEWTGSAGSSAATPAA
jgi:hypothetical protein